MGRIDKPDMQPDMNPFGNRRLIGQQNVREQLERAISSGRSSHAYLFTGPRGVGKTAFALAFAEMLNGISNLTALGDRTRSKKSSWFNHPDIHLFIPLPKAVADSPQARSTEMKNRLSLLNGDPYEVVDFRQRPVLDDDTSSKNRQAFYPIDYFKKEIRPKCNLKPNEGRYTVIIITEIESMRKEAANSFLKLLEEPPEDVIFLLTTGAADQILPTILSRCRQIRLGPLEEEEIIGGLVTYDGFSRKDATWLARTTGGNYALARYYDIGRMQETRSEVIRFLRMAYVQDAGELMTLIQDWQGKLNIENQIALCNALEIMLRDLMIYRETQNTDLIINIDQIEPIQSFCEALGDARIPDMISQLQGLSGVLYQNVQFKLVFTALAFRFSFLMRGKDPVIPDEQSWQHLPALNTGAF
ncbi:MAG: hypothetical protein WEC12_03870 [Balneolaceae bacterium]